jgi:hypothetical protein
MFNILLCLREWKGSFPVSKYRDSMLANFGNPDEQLRKVDTDKKWLKIFCQIIT